MFIRRQEKIEAVFSYYSVYSKQKTVDAGFQGGSKKKIVVIHMVFQLASKLENCFLYT